MHVYINLMYILQQMVLQDVRRQCVLIGPQMYNADQLIVPDCS